jgi:cytochrome bd-type quinol oxidase subunit 2
LLAGCTLGAVTSGGPVAGSTGPAARYRGLSILQFIGLVIAYLVVLRGLGALATSGLHDSADHLHSSREVTRQLLIPVAVSANFVYGAVAVLGWWRPVLTDDRPVQHWVWSVPAIFVVCSLMTIAYNHLADHGLGFTLLLLVSTLCVGAAEEGMFRGIGVVTSSNPHPSGESA